MFTVGGNVCEQLPNRAMAGGATRTRAGFTDDAFDRPHCSGLDGVFDIGFCDPQTMADHLAPRRFRMLGFLGSQ